MCGGFPSSTTRGEPPPKMTFWEAVVILWREVVTRPHRESWKERSRTMTGIAEAMADQWGNLDQLAEAAE